MTKKHTTSTILIGLGIILLGAFANGFLANLKKPPLRKDQGLAQGLPVSVIAVASDNFDLGVTGYGTVKPRVSLNLSAELSGNIVYRHPMLEAGNTIASGDILLKIDPEPYNLRLDRAKSQKVQAIAQLRAIEQEIEGQQKTLGISEALLKIQEKELKRFQSLAKAEAASRSQLDKAMGAFQTASAAKIRDGNNLTQARARKENLLATLEQTETSINEAQLSLSKTVIKAPFTAKIDERLVENGEFVSPGKPLLQLHDPLTYEVGVPLGLHDILWLTGQYKNAKNAASAGFSKALIGAKALVKLKNPGSEPGTCEWWGKIDRMSSQADHRNRTFMVFVSIDSNSSPTRDFVFPLSGGLFVEVDLSGGSANGLFKIPRNLISQENTVNILQDGRLKVKNIDVARVNKGAAYIQGEVEPGDFLITTSIPDVVPGMRLFVASDTVSPAEKAQ